MDTSKPEIQAVALFWRANNLGRVAALPVLNGRSDDEKRPSDVRLHVSRLSVAAVVAVLAKVLPKFLFNRTLYRVTGSKLALLLSLLLMIAVSGGYKGSLFSRASLSIRHRYAVHRRSALMAAA